MLQWRYFLSELLAREVKSLVWSSAAAALSRTRRRETRCGWFWVALRDGLGCFDAALGLVFFLFIWSPDSVILKRSQREQSQCGDHRLHAPFAGVFKAKGSGGGPASEASDAGSSPGATQLCRLQEGSFFNCLWELPKDDCFCSIKTDDILINSRWSYRWSRCKQLRAMLLAQQLQ